MDEKPKPTLSSIDEKLNKFIEETRESFGQKTRDDQNDFDFQKKVNETVNGLKGEVENLREEFKRGLQEMKAENTKLRKEIAPKKIIVQQLLHFSPNLWFRNLVNNFLNLFKKKN